MFESYNLFQMLQFEHFIFVAQFAVVVVPRLEVESIQFLFAMVKNRPATDVAMLLVEETDDFDSLVLADEMLLFLQTQR